MVSVKRILDSWVCRNISSVVSCTVMCGSMSQMLALRPHELNLLASFLGHGIQVHREFHPLPKQTLQMTKISKILIAMKLGETGELWIMLTLMSHVGQQLRFSIYTVAIYY